MGDFNDFSHFLPNFFFITYTLLFNPYASRLTSHSIAEICYSQGFFNTRTLILEILETDAFLKKFG